MRLQHVFGVTAGVCLGLVSSWIAQTVALSAEFAPQKQSLAVPVTVAGKPAGSLQCLVRFGPSVPVSALAFSPDGKTLAVGAHQEVLIWDLENAELAKRLAVGQPGG